MKLYTIIILLLTGVLTAQAQSIEEARVLAEDGQQAEAIDMLRTIVVDEPKNNEAALMLGRLLWATGVDNEAVEILEQAHKRGSRDATLELARIAYYRYNLPEARSLLASYRKSLRSGKKVVAEDLSGSLEDEIEKAEGMLDRVQNIEIIDSVDVDADDFFRYYPLSSAAGRIGGPEMLPKGFPADDFTTVEITESGNKMVWSAPDAEGSYRLYWSSPLYGEEWEAPQMMGEDLGDGGDAIYPYLMPDGITLYYSADNEDSLGGYDIFLSRRNDDEFLQPANVGMPFNSPYNDYLLVIDEFTGAGFFATDRNRHPGKVTIYTFVPQDLRVNVDIDNPNLTSLACLDNISLTRKPGVDYSSLLQAIKDNSRQAKPAQQSAAMKTYLEKQAKFDDIMTKLETLRRLYASGDHSQASFILRIEQQLPALRAELRLARTAAYK